MKRSFVREWPFAVLLLALVVCAASESRPRAQAPATTALLDRYLAGDFDAVIASVSARDDFDGLLKDLQRSGIA